MAIKKARSRPSGRNRAVKCVKPVSAHKGAEPYLTAETAVGMHQSIHLVYRRPCFLSIKKEACKSLFLFCNSGIACLRVWISTKQQYSQTHILAGGLDTYETTVLSNGGVIAPVKQHDSQTLLRRNLAFS